MTFAAVARGLRQIGTAIPFGALLWDGAKAFVSIEKGGPEAHEPTLIEGKNEGIWLVEPSYGDA